MELGIFAVYFLNALTLGLILGVVAAALTFVFGFLHIINFAHGAMYMLGAYIGYQVYVSTGQFWLALIVAPLCIVLLAVILNKYLFTRLQGHNQVYVVLLTYGIAIFIENLTKIIWGATGVSVPIPKLLSSYIILFGINYPVYKLFLLVFLISTVLIISFIFKKTKVGIMVRAGTEDREMASALGINVNLIGLGVFAFGAGLAALMGVVVAPDRALDPTIGVSILIDSFIVMVIGGMQNFTGSIIAGLFVGFIQVFGGIYFADLTMVFTLILMIGVITTNQKGLAGILKLS